MRNNVHYLFFIVSSVIIFLFLDYHNILFYRPQSIHFMRQTDCLSFVVTYYNYGMNFFEPRVLNLNSDNGKAIGEFPILYYLTAVFYKIFGEHEFFLRLINLSIVTVGLFYLYKLLLKVLSDIVYALSFTFLFFSSTILIYYTNNYLPDAAAFGFTLIGWYFYYGFFINRNRTRFFIISILFFTLASLLKVTYGLYLAAALLSLIVFEIFVNRKFSLKRYYPYLLSFMLSFLIIAAWYFYVIQYNKTNNVDSFLMHYKPIWAITSLQVADVWEYISNYWYTKYYYESTIHTFILLILAGLFFVKKSNKVILTFAITSTIGSLIYFFLFYSQFKAHDYYFIALIPAIIFLVISSFISIQNSYPKIIGNIFFKIVIITILILSLNYARDKVLDRYDENNHDMIDIIGWQLDNSEDYINSIGIVEEAKVIVIQDYTPNGSLYFLNRRGWTLSDTSDTDIKNLHSYIQEGAEYLLLTNTQYLNNNSINLVVRDIVGEYNDVTIYNLKNLN